MHMMRSIIYMITAYNIDMPINGPTSITEVESVFGQDGTFLTLRQGSEQNFPNALDDMRSLRSSLLSAYSFLFNETDSQSNDVVLTQDASSGLIASYDNTEYTILSFLADDGPLSQLFNNDVVIPYCQCINEEYSWPEGYVCVQESCQDITVNLSNFMMSPPNNMKSILPDYDIEVYEEVDMSINYESDSHVVEMDLAECSNSNGSFSYSLNSETHFY